jgi:hypothetical protein
MAKHKVSLAGGEVGMHIRTVSVPTRERLEVWQRCLELLVVGKPEQKDRARLNGPRASAIGEVPSLAKRAALV